MLSSYWLIHFSDLNITLLTSGRQILAAFQKSLAKSRNVSTKTKERIIIQKKIVYALPVFKRVLKIQKHLVLSGEKLIHSILYSRQSLKNIK